MTEPLRVAHLAALRCGDLHFDEDLAESVVEAVNAAAPEVVLVAGNLTASGYEWEYEQAVGYLERIHAPTVVVPGPADSRNVGYVHFERILGDRFRRRRIPPLADRPTGTGATPVTVLALDSSEPDLSTGRIGREWYPWIRREFAETDDLKIVLMHHPLVAVPGAGREAVVAQDAGDLLAVLSDLGTDMVLTGARHVPFFWGVNGMLLANCGTAATHRQRGTVPPSWNEFEIGPEQIRVYVHYPDGTRQPAAVRSRATRLMVREAFTVTDQFFASNHLPVG